MGRLITKVSFTDHAQWLHLAEHAGFQSCRLAQQIGLSRRQVERYIKRHFGLSPQQWLRQLRMARAIELIRVMHSVKEVAYALGFSQVSSFCHQFKAHYGMTCSEYAAVIAARRPPARVSDPHVVHFRLDPPATPRVTKHPSDTAAVG